MDLLQGLCIAVTDVLVVTEVDQVISIDDANDSPLPQKDEVSHLIVLRYMFDLVLELTSYSTNAID